jgi:hypothetical protein
MTAWRRVDQLAELGEERLRTEAYLRIIRKQMDRPITASEREHLKHRERYYEEWLATSDEEHLSRGDECFRCDICNKSTQLVWVKETACIPDCACDIVICEDCILALAEQVRKAREEVKP